jgi:hypothetical protein
MGEGSMMTGEDLRQNATNRQIASAMHMALERQFLEVMRRGWHGDFGLRGKVQDGVVQVFSEPVEPVTRPGTDRG